MPTLVLVAVLWHLLAPLLTFVVYWMDKRRAVAGARRIRERTLHTLGILGGWPGGLLAMRLVRHKSAKRSFQIVFVCSALAHIAVVCGSVILMIK